MAWISETATSPTIVPTLMMRTGSTIEVSRLSRSSSSLSYIRAVSARCWSSVPVSSPTLTIWTTSGGKSEVLRSDREKLSPMATCSPTSRSALR